MPNRSPFYSQNLPALTRYAGVDGKRLAIAPVYLTITCIEVPPRISSRVARIATVHTVDFATMVSKSRGNWPHEESRERGAYEDAGSLERLGDDG